MPMRTCTECGEQFNELAWQHHHTQGKPVCLSVDEGRPRVILIRYPYGGGNGDAGSAEVDEFYTEDAAIDHIIDEELVADDSWMLIEVANYLGLEVRHVVERQKPDGSGRSE